MRNTHWSSEVLRREEPGLPQLQVLPPAGGLENQTLVVPQGLQHDPGQGGGAAVTGDTLQGADGLKIRPMEELVTVHLI